MTDLKPKTKFKPFYLIAVFAIILTILFAIGISKSIDWFNKHEVIKNQIIAVTLKWPITIKAREPQIIEKPLVLDYPEEIDTPLEKYICDKWGIFECKTALAVSKAENGDRIRDRFNINSNGTIDVGIFQINSVHFSKEGCALFQIVDPIQNVDCAYAIWESSDGNIGDGKGSWTPWVTFNTQSYLFHLEK